MVSAFWFGVMNVWLNLVRASLKTRMFSLLSLERSTFCKSIHNRSSWLLVIIELGFVLDLYNYPSQPDIVDNLSHILLHLGTWYSNKIIPGRSQGFVPPQ